MRGVMGKRTHTRTLPFISIEMLNALMSHLMTDALRC